MLFKESLIPFLVAPIAAAASVPLHPIRDVSPSAEAAEKLPIHHGLDTFKKASFSGW